MYESHWQLNCRPFEHSADEEFYYPSESHQGALLKLRYAVENRHAAAVLCGPPGVGKTLLVRGLLDKLGDEFSPQAHLVFPDMPPQELVAYLAAELSGTVEPTGDGGLHQQIRHLHQTLAAGAAEGSHAVVVIDEAQVLEDTGALETVRLLLNVEPGGTPAMTLLLVGQPELLPALDRHPALEDRLGVKCLMRPMSQDETAAYVAHRLQAAGAQRKVFEDEAVDALHHLSGGVPRRINRLADLALLVGFAEEQPSIDAPQIESVSEELLTVKPE